LGSAVVNIKKKKKEEGTTQFLFAKNRKPESVRRSGSLLENRKSDFSCAFKFNEVLPVFDCLFLSFPEKVSSSPLSY
jgi:hypothetical protein